MLPNRTPDRPADDRADDQEREEGEEGHAFACPPERLSFRGATPETPAAFATTTTTTGCEVREGSVVPKGGALLGLPRVGCSSMVWRCGAGGNVVCGRVLLVGMEGTSAGAGGSGVGVLVAVVVG